MPATTARQRVLGYLKKQRSASAAQIGRGLDMSAADVRHHLSILLSDSRIAVTGATRTKTRGRPAKSYGLSEKMLGDNLALLSDAVLTEWLDSLSSDERQEGIQAIAKSWIAPLESSNQNFPITRRLSEVVEKLDALHYQAHWEAGAKGPRIVFAHCPYALIIAKHPELCQMDGAMLSDALGLSAPQIAKIGRAGAQSCIFLLGGSEQE